MAAQKAAEGDQPKKAKPLTKAERRAKQVREKGRKGKGGETVGFYSMIGYLLVHLVHLCSGNSTPDEH